MRTASRRCGGEIDNYCLFFAETRHFAPILLLAEVATLVKQGWVLGSRQPTLPPARLGRVRRQSEPRRLPHVPAAVFLLFQTVETTVSDARYGRWRSGRAMRNSTTFCAPTVRGASCPSTADERCSSSRRALKRYPPTHAAPHDGNAARTRRSRRFGRRTPPEADRSQGHRENAVRRRSRRCAGGCRRSSQFAFVFWSADVTNGTHACGSI